jgi:DNA-binding transcriptional LysR family regulator
MRAYESPTSLKGPAMNMHVTIRQLRALVAVVETGSFSEAAKAMSLSQAALSGLVSELENRVGVRLLDRNTRSVSLSAVGQSFEPMARRVLSTLEEALDSLADLKELRRGVVRVAAPETLSCTLMPELISTYRASNPDIEVHFEDVPIEMVLAGLLHGNTDIGFGPAGVIADDAVDVQVLWPDPLWVALPPDDPLAGAASIGAPGQHGAVHAAFPGGGSGAAVDVGVAGARLRPGLPAAGATAGELERGHVRAAAAFHLPGRGKFCPFHPGFRAGLDCHGNLSEKLMDEPEMPSCLISPPWLS